MDREQQVHNAEKHPSRSATGWKILAVTATAISALSLMIAVAAIALVFVHMRPANGNTSSNISQREVMSVSYTPADQQRKTEMLKTVSFFVLFFL